MTAPPRPERIYHVSKTQLSIARYYGGCKYNGANYHYDEPSDTLVRMDLWVSELAADKVAAKAAAAKERAKWSKAQESFASF